MFYTLNAGLMGLGITAAMALGGCASTPTNEARPAAAGAPSTQAVACTKCEVTYIKVPTNDPKGRFVGYSNHKVMECPECKSAAQNFFETGKLAHPCTHCQGTMEVCDSHM